LIFYGIWVVLRLLEDFNVSTPFFNDVERSGIKVRAKLDQAQFRELEAFAKFGSDLDAATLNVIEKGRRNVEILKQAQNDPYTVEDQVAIIYAGSKNLLRNVPVDKVKEFETAFLTTLKKKHKKSLAELKSGKLTDNALDTLNAVAKETSKVFE
jgi:F-type H+-transporting ATPase subunit alpha